MRQVINKFSFLIGALVLFVIAGLNSCFIVTERQYAIVFFLGEARTIVRDAGLHFKIPFVTTVGYFDKRLLETVVEAKELTTDDEKRIIIDAFVKFVVSDPVSFYKTVKNLSLAEMRISRILESNLRQVIGKIKMIDLLTDKRIVAIEQVKDNVHADVKNLGIDIVDVRIVHSDLPKKNSNAIYRRMQTERHKEAQEIRASGDEQAMKIRVKANTQAKNITSDAYLKAETLKADGDLTAAEIYNKAFGADIEFYKFYRKILSYKDAMTGKKTRFVISPKSKFMDEFDLQDRDNIDQ